MSAPLPYKAALAALAVAGCAVPLHAGFFYNGVSPASPRWPGGTIPYVIDQALLPAQQQTYLDGIREWELAGNIHFVPHSSETDYILFKYNPAGPNSVSGGQPQLVQINALTRSQICHETGHSLGLTHEHIRTDRDGFVNVLTANISSGNAYWFDIDPAGVLHGGYDFESVMHFGRDLFSTNPGTLDTLSPQSGYERYQVRMGNLALSPGDRAAIAYIYGAAGLSSVVTHTGDAGPGSLRAALYYATDHPGATITFNIPNSDPNFSGGVFTIYPTGHLPTLVTNGTIIDATSQPGYAGSPLVFIDGSEILTESGEPPGLMVYAANCTIKGLGFTRARWVGVALLHPDAAGNVVSSCWCGVGPTGNAALANTKQGVQISDGAHDNIIGPGNVLSGNTEYGIWISDAATRGNIVRGNRIGTNANGDAALTNGLGGVIVTGASHDNVIDGGNVISGNNNAGIRLTGAGVDGNVARGNFIGVNAAGTSAIPNGFVGLYAIAGAAGNLIEGNVIAGNGVGFGYGMVIADAGSDGNVVDGNLIGVLRNGGALGNSFAGLAVWGGAKDSTISGNVIRNNGGNGVALYDAGTDGHTITGNSISENAFDGIAIGPANHSQAAPSLSSAVAGAGGVAIAGTLNSAPSASFRVEFFSGKNFLGASDGIATDGGGLANFSPTLTAAVLAGKTITATATNAATGETSAFSFPVTVTTTDTDGDGMPDAYETAHGLSTAIDDANADADGDGVSNLNEYLAGTNPRSGADFFRPLSVARTGGNLSVKFSVAPGRTYQIEESPSLDAGSWRILVPLNHPTTNELEVLIPFGSAAARKFYRALRID